MRKYGLFLVLIGLLLSFSFGYFISFMIRFKDERQNSNPVNVVGGGVTSKPIFNPPLPVDGVGIDEAILTYTIQGSISEIIKDKIPHKLVLQTADGKKIGPTNIDSQVYIQGKDLKKSMIGDLSKVNISDEVRINLTYNLFSDGSYNSNITYIYLK